MAEHHIQLTWEKGAAPFTYDAYPRNHTIAFKNGQETVIASASPNYKGDAGKTDPEDLLVAALSSCHMLSFLAIAAKKKLTVNSYQDNAVGFLENDGGKLWITRVVLKPKVVIDTDTETLAQIHHMAHEACFIANSVKTQVSVEPQS
ncbi:MAG TPA: OsmC family protein [Rhizomicrobium sp.]|jgi:organic hydroperoxide reductase OsmC/OhrA|nr:OsmC family protein [Rhizomicrobium sp.]